jgi:peroxiredoxin
VHVGTDAGEVVSLLSEALASRKRREPVVAVGVVRPAGKDADLRKEDGEQPAGSESVLLVEDRDGSWAEATGLADGGAVLIGPRGEVAWQSKDGPTARHIANALDRYAKDVGEGGHEAELATQPITFAVRPGLRPPDVPIRLPDGSELSLLRFKGRGLAVVFYTYRSEPSIEHLETLREVGDGGEEGPLVIAIGDGEAWDAVAALVEERRLPFLVVADADRLVARSFGIWAWPVTVWIRPDQRIEAIDIGAIGVSGTGQTRA